MNMKKRMKATLAAVFTVGVISFVLALIIVYGGKWNILKDETSLVNDSGVVADFNDRQEEALSYATLTDHGKYWELADDGADSWLESSLTFTIDGLNAGNNYVAYIDAVGDGATTSGGYWLIYDNADNGALLASKEAVDESVSIQFTPSVSAIKVMVMPAESYMWDNNIKTAHFVDFRIKNETPALAADADLNNEGELISGTTEKANQEWSGANSEFVGKTCVCFGDSVTGFMEPPNDYPSVLASNTGMTVYNVGYAGCRMSDTHPFPAYKRFGMVSLTDAIMSGDWSEQDEYVDQIEAGTFPQEHLSTLKSIDWSTVDYITIFYGGNDAGNYVLIDNPQNPTDTTTYLGAARYVYNRWHTAYPNIKIMFFVPMYRYWIDEGKDSNEMQFEAGGGTYYYYDWGDALIDYFTKIGVPVVDMYRTLGINESNRKTYLLADGTHPTELGNKLIASKFEEQLYDKFVSKEQ